MGYPEYYDYVCTSCWNGTGYYSIPDGIVGCRACGRYVNDMIVPPNASGTEIPYVSSIPTQKVIQKIVRASFARYLFRIFVRRYNDSGAFILFFSQRAQYLFSAHSRHPQVILVIV